MISNTQGSRALLIVDPQIDFISGSLAVGGAQEAMDALAQYVEQAADRYALIAVTRDFHPSDHCSFAAQGGPWPPHCVGATDGARIYPPLLQAIGQTAATAVTLNKGVAQAPDEYSAMVNNEARTAFTALVDALHITSIDICGLAGDICVASTLTDAARLLPDIKFNILTRFSPSIDNGSTLAAAALNTNSTCNDKL